MMVLKIDESKLLTDMYSDEYFPNHLVDKVKSILLTACKEIESQKPKKLEELYTITCQATELINDLQGEFEESDSEIETVARDDIVSSFEYIATMYGFTNADVEGLVATRDW
ncbi:hypothetical protein KCM76_20330 [Zooshikella marina]|uniref:DUF5713 family protein n=1 Tax=Zooshikella ganghwensis TaxID=202772 RepID=UPI001BB0512E|nr:DUF5713 family protein [Zooshikella ganghwensis]MBU2708351.1 hypothetical protein [Zooshikella ganghwensis]